MMRCGAVAARRGQGHLRGVFREDEAREDALLEEDFFAAGGFGRERGGSWEREASCVRGDQPLGAALPRLRHGMPCSTQRSRACS